MSETKKGIPQMMALGSMFSGGGGYGGGGGGAPSTPYTPTPTVMTGPNGGSYVEVNGKKHYVDPGQTQQQSQPGFLGQLFGGDQSQHQSPSLGQTSTGDQIYGPSPSQTKQATKQADPGQRSEVVDYLSGRDEYSDAKKLGGQIHQSITEQTPHWGSQDHATAAEVLRQHAMNDPSNSEAYKMYSNSHQHLAKEKQRMGKSTREPKEVTDYKSGEAEDLFMGLFGSNDGTKPGVNAMDAGGNWHSGIGEARDASADMGVKGVSKATSDAIDILKAGGEGSRGGQVIGHTQSGKPIYAPSSGHLNNLRGPVKKEVGYENKHLDKKAAGYTEQDHLDAAEAHKKEQNKLHFKRMRSVDDPSEGNADTMLDQFRAHGRLAARHEDKAKDANFDYQQKQKQGDRDFFAQRAKDAVSAERRPQTQEDVVPEYNKSTTRDAIDLLKASGEGSRGGKVIGHTRSGKPIYEPGASLGKHDAKASAAIKEHGWGEGSYGAVGASQRAIDRHVNSYSKDFTPEDHRDAVNVLKDHKADLGRDGNTSRNQEFAVQGVINRHSDADEKGQNSRRYAAIDNHEGLSSGTTERRAASGNPRVFKSEGGEGSRGGKVIGHTSSGKPVYENKHPRDYEGFSRNDHEDASKLHTKESDASKEKWHDMGPKDKNGLPDISGKKKDSPAREDTWNDHQNYQSQAARHDLYASRAPKNQGDLFGNTEKSMSKTRDAINILKGMGDSFSSGAGVGQSMGSGLGSPGGGAAAAVGPAQQVASTGLNAVSPTEKSNCEACKNGACDDHMTQDQVSKAIKARALAIPFHLRQAHYDPESVRRSATQQTSRMYTSLAEPVRDTFETLKDAERLRMASALVETKKCATHGTTFKSTRECPICMTSKSMTRTDPRNNFGVR